jgi:hypothetical protein
VSHSFLGLSWSLEQDKAILLTVKGKGIGDASWQHLHGLSTMAGRSLKEIKGRFVDLLQIIKQTQVASKSKNC